MHEAARFLSGRAPLDILQSVIPVFLVVAAGVVLRRYRFLDGGFIDGTIVIVSTAASAVTITSWLFVLRAFGW